MKEREEKRRKTGKGKDEAGIRNGRQKKNRKKN